jgi:outer membrane receptor for ferrienterochelin and colicins
VSHKLRRRTYLLALVVIPFLLPAALARTASAHDAQTLPPGSATDQANPDQAKNADDIDKLLDMADKNVAGLAKVNVATATDPIVEGVSKKAEKLSESPGIVDVITAKDIQDFGAKNLFEVLQRATSTFMTGSFLYRNNVAAMRGNLQNHEDNHVLVLINGRPFRDVTLGGVNVSMYTAFPIQTIERVEVIRGPGSVLYGTNAFNGVINVVTKDPDKPTMYAGVLSGSHGWQSYSVAGGSGNPDEGAYAGATQSREKGWPFTATTEAPGNIHDTEPWGEDNIGVFTMYRKGGFTMNMFVARANNEMLGPLDTFPSAHLDDPRVFMDLGYLLKIDDCQNIQTDFTYNYDGTNFPSAVPGLPFNTRSNSYLIESTYHNQLSDQWSLMIGGFTDIHEGMGQIPTIAESIPEYTEVWYGIYAQLEYQMTDWLKLIGGMQENLPGTIPAGCVPRAGVIATLNENWTAKFLYGQAFRSPYQLERSISVPGVLFGNPDLVPETIQTFDAQIAYHTEKFRLAATYFHSDYFNIITRSNSIPQFYSNGGSMRFDGVELENDWELSKCWRCLGSTTYQRNIRDQVPNTTEAPQWMAKGGIDYHTPDGWNVGLFDVFYSAAPIDPNSIEVNPDTQATHEVTLNTTLDLDQYWHWHAGRSLRLQFMVENLLNEPIIAPEFEREIINTLPAGAGRTYYGGLTMEY